MNAFVIDTIVFIFITGFFLMVCLKLGMYGGSSGSPPLFFSLILFLATDFELFRNIQIYPF